MAKKERKKLADDSEEYVLEEGEEPQDIYDEEIREEMLENDEITATEEGFMRGWDGTVEGGKKKRKAGEHKDTVSVELVKDQYTED
jgi:hypothetical protein